jgi:hypothetical protein
LRHSDAEDGNNKTQTQPGAIKIASISVNQVEMESSMGENNGISGLRTIRSQTFFGDCVAILKLVFDFS